ncbi:hypothetical protein [Bacillus sp. 37MA]|uniref:hypothetical protein n=1 Tax=Bacillus sp. 37MA TaxID=1132442 RepID=UPI0018C9582A|nr:hypothetical protein [Bacillus sp. 37MA]
MKEASLYSDIEVRIPEAAGILSSANGGAEKAADIIADLYDRVILLTGTSSYTWWDAALVLLREGLEAVVIIRCLFSENRPDGCGKMDLDWCRWRCRCKYRHGAYS